MSSCGFLRSKTSPAQNMGRNKMPISSQAPGQQRVPAGTNSSKPMAAAPSKNRETALQNRPFSMPHSPSKHCCPFGLL